jgi:protein-tyrosine kinase
MKGALALPKNAEQAQPLAGLGPFLQLLSVLQRSKGGPSASGIFGLTSAVRGEGVSYVAKAIGSELALLPRERILLAQASVLSSLTSRDVEESGTALREVSPQLWTAPAAPMLVRQVTPDLRPDLLDELRKRFTYVLLDCHALRSSPEILRIASQLDGIVLVVGAGQSRRDQVLQAQKVLQLASDKLLGCILNKQTNPTPAFFSKYSRRDNTKENGSRR